jgi:hypothetical protein
VSVSGRFIVVFHQTAHQTAEADRVPKFPGYPANVGSCQVRPLGDRSRCHTLTPKWKIHVLDWTRNRQPIKRSKLAHDVAKKLEQYLNHIAVRCVAIGSLQSLTTAPQKFTIDRSVEGRWKVGEGFMNINNMFLVGLESVSKGSFQPDIWVIDSSMPHVRAAWE